MALPSKPISKQQQFEFLSYYLISQHCSARQCSVAKRPVVQIVVQLWCSFLNQSVSSFKKQNEVSEIKKLSDNNKRSCIRNRISQS